MTLYIDQRNNPSGDNYKDIWFNNKTPKYIEKLTELKGEVDICEIIVRVLNISFQIMDRTSRQKMNKELGDLNSTIK